jgi:hypothetical protein
VTGPRRGDAGSLSLEYVLTAPLILLVFGLIFAFGLIAETNGVLDAGTRDAARAASRSATYAQALQAAERIVREEVGTGSDTCLRTLTVALTPAGELRPGETLTVRSSCTYALGDSIGGIPGSLSVSSAFSSMVDPNRGLG